jgi:hypothetical protein
MQTASQSHQVGIYCLQPTSASHAPPAAMLHTLVAAGLQGRLRMPKLCCCVMLAPLSCEMSAVTD